LSWPFFFSCRSLPLFIKQYLCSPFLTFVIACSGHHLITVVHAPCYTLSIPNFQSPGFATIRIVSFPFPANSLLLRTILRAGTHPYYACPRSYVRAQPLLPPSPEKPFFTPPPPFSFDRARFPILSSSNNSPGSHWTLCDFAHSATALFF